MLFAVYGQAIRPGVFQEKVLNEAFDFKPSLPFMGNPNMAANDRFPTGVDDFKYEINN